MSLSGIMIIVVLAAFCGYAAGVGEVIFNFEKIDVVNTENKITGKWSASIVEAKPMNKITMETPLISDVAPDQLMLRMKAEMDGNALPLYEKSACEGLQDEMIGKSVVEAGNPFPSSCPAAANVEYRFSNFLLNTKKLPPGMPDGKIKGVLDVCEKGKDPLVSIIFEATLSHNVGGMG